MVQSKNNDQYFNEKIRPYLLRLVGTPKEMGRAHGVAVREANALGCIFFYGRLLDHIFCFQLRNSLEKKIYSGIRWFVEQTLEKRLIQQIPTRYREAIQGFSEGSGVPLEVVLKAYVMPDAYTFLLSLKHKYSFFPSLEQTPLGCSALVTTGYDSQRIPFLHGRNLDFPGGQKWSDFPAIIEYQPHDGQKYVTVTTLGVDTAGVTATNEAGITISLNMNYSRHVQSQAVPIVIIGHEIMRRAKSLKDAIEILESFPRSGGWSYVISSYREKNAIAVEMDASELQLRGLQNNHLVCTNHYSFPTLLSHEYWITEGRKIDSQTRHKQASQMVRNTNGRVDIPQLAKILGDSYDPLLGKERSFGYTISQVHTVSSVIFDPQDRRVYVACGLPPVAKQDYLAFELFPGPFQKDWILKGSPKDDAMKARFHYARAFESYFPAQDLEEVARHLEIATSLMPEESLYWSILSIVLAKVRKIRDAKITMQKTLEIRETAYRENQNRLYFARILDLCRERNSALEQYRFVAEQSPHSLFRKAALRGLRTPWSSAKLQRLVIDFTIGDFVEV